MEFYRSLQHVISRLDFQGLFKNNNKSHPRDLVMLATRLPTREQLGRSQQVGAPSGRAWEPGFYSG